MHDDEKIKVFKMTRECIKAHSLHSWLGIISPNKVRPVGKF